MLETMKLIKFANVLILNEKGEVLILRRTASHQTRPLSLDIPGGGLEPGESFKQAAVREVFEETGLAVALEDIQLVTRRRQTTPERSIEGALFFVKYRCADRKVVTLSDEHDRYLWIKPKDITGLPEFHQESIEHALKSGVFSK